MQDLSRYPVFPWVIADYKKSKVGLDEGIDLLGFDRPNRCVERRPAGILPTTVRKHAQGRRRALFVWNLLFGSRLCLVLFCEKHA
jgi:hypothetical protein